MANDLNQCSFIGRLGKDPETRYTPSNTAVVSFSIAVGSSWKDKTGQKQESTEWVNITAFGKLGEIVSQYCHKGDQVYIQGRLKTEKYQDKQTGQDRYSTKIIADRLQMLGSKNNGQQAQATQQPAAQGQAEFEDDIPF